MGWRLSFVIAVLLAGAVWPPLLALAAAAGAAGWLARGRLRGWWARRAGARPD